METALIHQMTSERQRCPDVAFIEGSNEYRSNVDILAYLAFKSVVYERNKCTRLNLSKKLWCVLK